MRIDRCAVSLVEIIQSTVNTYYPAFVKNNNQLKTVHGDAILNVNCDERRVSQVLVNLIANAAKHTRNGLITISTYQMDGFAVVAVADNGSGIAGEHLPLLFERYNSRNGEKEIIPPGNASGTGLGLYICKHIIESHGGSITVESELQKGTTVCFTLPLDVDAINRT